MAYLSKRKKRYGNLQRKICWSKIEQRRKDAYDGTVWIHFYNCWIIQILRKHPVQSWTSFWLAVHGDAWSGDASGGLSETKHEGVDQKSTSFLIAKKGWKEK